MSSTVWSSWKWRVVVCGSMSAYSGMVAVRECLRDARIPAIVPIAENDIHDAMSEQQFLQFKRKVAFQHLREIRNPATYAVLAFNQDKYGVSDYIGPNTFAEIAVGFAQSKRIYLYQQIPAIYEDELRAWGAISLAGDLSRLVKDFERFCDEQTAQLTLFME